MIAARTRIIVLLASAITCSCVAVPTRAAVHALVYGFNAYPFIQSPLTGAVADADDIATALKTRGIDDVVERTETATRHADFMKDWVAMTARAQTGDLLIFAFAGHGIRLQQTVSGQHTRYGDDKGFLLPQYDNLAHAGEALKRPEELLRDEDLYDLFKKTAAERGVHILFIADACHAGSGLRAIPKGALRVYIPRASAVQAPAGPPNTSAVARPPIAGVAAIGAQMAEKTIAEVKIDDRPRGALSYALARAIDGTAANLGHGALTLDDLFTYVRDVVRERSDNEQEPILFARNEDGGMLLLGSGETAGPALPPLPPLPEVKTFTGEVPVAGVPSASAADRADLIWDPQRQRLSDLAGDSLVDGVSAARLPSAVAARRLLLFLRKAGELRGPLTVSMHHRGAPPKSVENGFQLLNTQLEFESALSPLPFVTVFDLNSDGTVQFLAPRNGDTPAMAATPTFAVKPPFGADFVVFIRSKEPLAELDDFFARSGDVAPAADIFDVLSRDLRANDVRIGIQGLYTCGRLTREQQCTSSPAH